MKLYYYALLIVLPLVAFSVTDVSADALRGGNKHELASVEDTSAEAPRKGNERELASSAYKIGKELAEEYWDDNGPYNCGDFYEITTAFMADVESDVYDDCEDDSGLVTLTFAIARRAPSIGSPRRPIVAHRSAIAPALGNPLLGASQMITAAAGFHLHSRAHGIPS